MSIETNIRHDHGSQYMSRDFQKEITWPGAASSPAFVRAPEGNGCAERFIRTLKENVLRVRIFRAVDDLRLALIVQQLPAMMIVLPAGLAARAVIVPRSGVVSVHRPGPPEQECSMRTLKPELAGHTAAKLLEDRDVATVLAIPSADVSRLARVLVADPGIAAELAAALLVRHAPTVEAIEHMVMNATARRDHEDGEPVVTFELDPTTRKCVRVISALELIAAAGSGRSAA